MSDPVLPTILAVGGQHACVVLSQSRGTMCWGANDLGQLGNGSYTQSDFAVAVDSSDLGVSVDALAAGDKHTCATVNGGKSLSCWGDNTNGQLGTGGNVSSNLPAWAGAPDAEPCITWSVIAAGLSNTCGASASTNAIYCWGAGATGANGDEDTLFDQYRPNPSAMTLPNLSSITARGGTFYALASTGELYAWGDNSYGQAGLGLGARVVPAPMLVANNATTIASGLNFACMTSGTPTEQQLSCFGDNSLGQLGPGSDMSMSNVPVVVSPGSTGEWTSIGASYNTVFAFQTAGNFGAADIVASKIVRQTVKSLARDAEALAPASVEPARAPEAVGPSSDDVPSDDAPPTGLYAWGSNEAGALLISSPMGQEVVSPAFAAVDISSVDGGVDYACGLMGSAPNVACWGLNSSGQLGSGVADIYTSIPVPLNLGYPVTNLSAGASHVCVNLGDDAPQMTWCWGANEAGQLGDGTYSSSATPTPAWEGGSPFSKVAAGGAHTCAIRPSNLSLMCWGDNTYGQMGVNIVGGNSNQPQTVADVPGYGAGEWLFVAAGASNTCGTLATTGVYCWGSAATGGNGNNDLVYNVLLPSSMVVAEITPAGIAGKNNTFFVWSSDGIAFAWGENSSGQTGLIDYPPIVATASALEITGIKAIAAGNDFGLALQSDSSVFSFGSNASGQLGIGSTAAVSGPQQVLGQWTDIGAGGSAGYAVGVPSS
ncbi:hypothetical protein H632_c1504p0 [Helicosporidium sp. ATCC 50920]|nr:hypothetical protein H632_c1504p0 [Helicosporidium sp. ATCC 50920]|eukprot:KDD74186.1 hypothetical protein H632_c1504p0 [Helicosporidium sp. ATCC 50920]